jgi:hypothetical protein
MERRGEMPFVTSGESPIVSLIDQMNAALKEAGIERSSFEKYTVYSLRAVNALRNGVVLKCRHFGAPGGNSKLVTASAETVLDRATVLPLLPDGPAALVPLTSRTTLLASSQHRFVAPTRASMLIATASPRRPS